MACLSRISQPQAGPASGQAPAVRLPPAAAEITRAKILIQEAGERFNLIDAAKKDEVLQLLGSDPRGGLQEVARLNIPADTKKAYALRYTMVAAMNFGVTAEDGRPLDRDAFNRFNKLPLDKRELFVRRNRLDEVCAARQILESARRHKLIEPEELSRLSRLKPTEFIASMNEEGYLARFGEKTRELNAVENAGRVRQVPDEGFSMLFNGRDFNGWAGAVEEFEISDGVMRCRPNQGGVIFTVQEFENFVLKFDFKLSPGGNNGVAVRYPGAGDPAYCGMCEVQILDNPRDVPLDPTQLHGAAYGMAGPSYPPELLKPPGLWNSQTVTVQGSTVTVELNGTQILDADLSQIDKFLGDTPHPGRDLRAGHIGFAGHSDPVEIANIQVKRLPP